MGWLAEHFSITCVDPAVPALLKEFPTEMFEERAENLKQAMRSFRKVFFPIFSANHWTLLVAEKESLEQNSGFAWKVMKASAEAETMVGSLVDPEFTLPQRTNSVYQKQGSLDCGFFVLGWMEEELRVSRGEWLRAWIEHTSALWRESLMKLFQHLAKERAVIEKELAQQRKTIEKQEAKQLENKAAAEARLEQIKNKSSAAAEAAKLAIKKNSERFTWQDLSATATNKIKSLEHSICICSKCRWQSGCAECDPWKALRFRRQRLLRRSPFQDCGQFRKTEI